MMLSRGDGSPGTVIVVHHHASPIRRVAAPRRMPSRIASPVLVRMPPLQRAFGTTGLGPGDWLLCVVAASAVLWLREASKLVVRVGQARD